LSNAIQWILLATISIQGITLYLVSRENDKLRALVETVIILVGDKEMLEHYQDHVELLKEEMHNNGS